MNTNLKNIIAVSILSAFSGSAMAQNTDSGYFLDGYLYRHEMNPAFDNERNYVSMPALGNLNLSLRGNIAVDDVFYNVNGRTTTFMNPLVSVSEVMGNLSDNNKLNLNVKEEILSAGFKAFGGYNTVGISVRAFMGANLPRDLFSLIKEGASNRTYDISDVNAYTDSYAELAFGHSRDINDNLRVGAKVKFLLGLANVDAQFKNVKLTLGEDSWNVMADAMVESSIKGLAYQHEINENTNHEYVSGAEIDGFGLNGFGLAFDLGAEYRLNDDWAFSASVLDLGFVGWNNNMLATTNGLQEFSTDKYTFNVNDDAVNNFDDEFEKMKDDLSGLYELNDEGDQGGRTKMIGATINLGAEYTLPVYNKLKFGLMNSTRIQGRYSWTEFRLSANVAPVDVFSANVNMAAGTYGVSFGWLLNFHTTGFGLFVGMDHTFGSTAKQGVPMSGNASMNLGINFPF